MQNAHGYAWECRAPSHDPILFNQEVDFQEHSRTEHGVPEGHVATLSGAARRPVFEKIPECPFGDDFSPLEEAGSTNVSSNEALYRHVAAHMKEIALLALQKLPSDDDRFEDVASDQPLEEAGDGFAKLRGSMYSVLDDDALDFPNEAEDGVSNIVEDGIGSSIDKLDLEDKDNTGMTKLHHAATHHSFPLVQSLINQGANLRSRSNDGKTALHYACLHSNSETSIIKLLLSKSEVRELVNLKDDNGQTPLHYASKSGFANGIRLLIDCGAEIDIHDNHGFSPYLWAAIAGKDEAIGLLLSVGVDIDSTSPDGKSALGWAASLGHTSVAGSLIRNGADLMSTTRDTQSTPLEQAAAFGSLPAIKFLLPLYPDLNRRDRDGWSAIHWAAEEGHLSTVMLLLENGADLNAVSSYGTSPLHCAANGGHTSIVRELLRRGADPTKFTCHGWTPLHHAAFMGYYDVVRILLQTSSLTQDNHGWSALHLAVHGRYLDTVRLLRDSPRLSESRPQRDENGLTPAEWLDFEFDTHSYKTISNLAFGKSSCCRAVTGLRQAARSGNVAMTEYFLQERYNVNETDSGNRTALYYAAKKDHIQILNMLLERDADPNIIPRGRKTWEECISNDTVLRRLRRAGYTKPIPDPKIDHRIRIALQEGGRTHTLDQPASERSVTTENETESGPVGKTSERSRISKFWKRLRGQ